VARGSLADALAIVFRRPAASGELMPTFYIATRSLVPTFNIPTTRTALNLLAECFPDRTLSGSLRGTESGGWERCHCMTSRKPCTGARIAVGLRRLYSEPLTASTPFFRRNPFRFAMSSGFPRPLAHPRSLPSHSVGSCSVSTMTPPRGSPLRSRCRSARVPLDGLQRKLICKASRITPAKKFPAPTEVATPRSLLQVRRHCRPLARQAMSGGFVDGDPNLPARLI